jgi:signal transduction histidine kinase
MRKKKHTHWHEYGPPWWDAEQWKNWQEWGHGHPHSPWIKRKKGRERWHHSDKYLFARFVAIFGFIVLLGCAALVALAALGAAAILFLREQPFPIPLPDPPLFEGHGEHPLRWLAMFLGLAFLLIVILRRVGLLASRRITSPLNQTMKAADALAEGDLSVRVSEGGGGEFRRLARSFNHMAQSLEVADRQRRELLADVAHELRTPLTVIQGNLEGLRDGVYDATTEHLDLVLDETHKLGHLVDDLRLLTLAEAGQLPLDFQVLDVSQLLADVRDAFACPAHEGQVSLTVDVSGPLPPLIADPQRLGQVLGNLVTNALRHTPPGGQVTLGADLPSGEAVPRGVRLWVADTGEGIAAEDLPRIFDRFWRADPARSHEARAGSGLGLAIAKSLVEAHGGRIWAQSQVGQGTIVLCILPLSADEF